MLKLDVALGERAYPILIGQSLLAEGHAVPAYVSAQDILLVTNTTVGPLYADQVTASLKDRRIVDLRLPDGEQYKTLDNVSRVLDVLVANRFGRDSIVLALGGGVVGDLAGFSAACYQRGVGFAQVPTTLLAQVDSSVGGKTGVNHPGGKNLIGAFHQPRAVISDTRPWRPCRSANCGRALPRSSSTARVWMRTSWRGWSRTWMRCCAWMRAALAHAIHRSCELKAQVVLRDEHEQGERALLNFGHTFGHAIEAATGYTQWLHGEAVAAGMVIAADMSARLGLIAAADVKRVAELLDRAGLATPPPRIGAERARQYMSVDKKVKGGRIRLVLLEALGRARFTADYPDDVLAATLAAHFG